MKKNKKINKLISYLNSGKTVVGSIVGTYEKREATTTASITKTPEGLYLVEIEKYFSDIDISEFNIFDKKETFTSLDDATEFLKEKFSISFSSMHG